jgi:hypothetical protein
LKDYIKLGVSELVLKKKQERFEPEKKRFHPKTQSLVGFRFVVS